MRQTHNFNVEKLEKLFSRYSQCIFRHRYEPNKAELIKVSARKSSQTYSLIFVITARKVMFSQVCVIPSVHGVGVGFPACTGKGGLASQHALGRGSASGEGVGQTLPPPPPRYMGYGQPVGGTHPTGMHSCLFFCLQTSMVTLLFNGLLWVMISMDLCTLTLRCFVCRIWKTHWTNSAAATGNSEIIYTYTTTCIYIQS